LEKVFARAKSHDNLRAFAKLCVPSGTEVRLASHPPLLVPLRQLFAAVDADRVAAGIREAVERYRHTLAGNRRALFDQFEIVDIARKVVGVGSVGTRCYVVLLRGKGAHDVLFLQVKQAEPSVLEPYVGASDFPHHGRRVVEGQRLLQSLPDIFLGWTTGPRGFDYYVRQLWDMKGSIDPAKLTPGGLGVYGGMCGWTLARAHGRGGDEIAIAGYLGKSDVFDEAITDFALTYADLNAQDHTRLTTAAAAGTIPITPEP
jgi:uncharacterized protein DUF2252